MADPITLGIALGAVGQAVAVEVAWSVAANYAISTLAFDAILYATAAAISTIGYAALSPGLPGVEGPRASDNQSQFSVYGKFIPITYGRSKSSGNVIWTSGLREVKNTQEVGGKGGGGGQTVTTYTYFGSWALALSEGKVKDIHRIWFDSDLIYDAEAESSKIPNFLDKVTFYYGDEEQLPDPTIEASKGVGNAPAYRGICYIVFHDLELTDWGNRIPNVTVELSRFPDVGVTSEVYPLEYLEGTSDAYISSVAYTIGDIFVKNFYQVYENWEPEYLPEASTEMQSGEFRDLLKSTAIPIEYQIEAIASIISAEFRQLLKSTSAPIEYQEEATATVVSGQFKVILLSTSLNPEYQQEATAIILGGSLV